MKLGIAGGRTVVRRVRGAGPEPQSFLAAKTGWLKAWAGNRQSECVYQSEESRVTSTWGSLMRRLPHIGGFNMLWYTCYTKGVN